MGDHGAPQVFECPVNGDVAMGFLSDAKRTYRQLNASHMAVKSALRPVGSHKLRHKHFNG
jgi:hypothetical protein